MPRMLVSHVDGIYHAIVVAFDNDADMQELVESLVCTYSIQSFLAWGDILSFRNGNALRASNRKPARRVKTFQEVLDIAEAEGAHRLMIRDTHGHVFDDIGDWNMTCEPGEDLFIENISKVHSWYHVLDGRGVYDSHRDQLAA